MAIHRVVFLALLLLSGTVLLGSRVESAAAKACPRNCDTDIAYMVCPSSGERIIRKVCTNCCAAQKGCKLFRSNGSIKCTGT
ncbi:proteinase inhibitor PSI-1.2-like [Capsicum chacoense]|nr:Proteinase inhibitor PSI-1.2 [Capsicum annuum]